MKEFKEKYGFTDKVVLCDFNGIRERNGKKYVNAYTRQLDGLSPHRGSKVICFQGDDSVWIRGTVTTIPRIGKYFDSLGHTFEVELDWDDFGYIEEYTFSDAIRRNDAAK